MQKQLGATITQWILDQDSCSCNLPEAQSLPEPNLPLCLRCSRPLPASDRAGSFTQWIIRQAGCTCEDGGIRGSGSDRNYSDSITKQTKIEQDGDIQLLEELGLPASRYSALELISKGNTSVYRCWDKSLDRMVAIKKFGETNLTNEQIIQFQNEARTTSRLHHENIVQMLDFGLNDEGQPYMAMEFVEGISLSGLLKTNGSLSAEEALSLVSLVAQAMDFAHQKGIYHRDLKSANILVADHGPRIKVIDFGIARVFHGQETTADGTLNLEGTLGYMSPEQLAGKKFDARSEVYSLACVLFEVLTGRLPFVADNALALLELCSTEDLPSLSQVNPQGVFSEGLEAFIARALASAPALRPQSMKDMQEEMTNLLDGIVAAKNLDLFGQVEAAETPAAVQNSRSGIVVIVLMIVGIAAVLFVGVLTIDSVSQPKTFPVVQLPKEKLLTAYLDDSLGDAEKEMANPPSDARRLVGADDQSIGRALSMPLRGLNIRLSHELTDKGIAKVVSIKGLRNLVLDDCPNVTYLGYRSLAPLQLQFICLTHCNLSPAVVPELANISTLDRINLRGNPLLRNADFGSFKRLKNLHALDLSKIPLSESDIKKVSGLPGLFELTLNETDLSDADMAEIAKLKNLMQLDIRLTKVTDVGLMKLSTLPKLQVLFVTPGTITDAGLRAFRSAARHCQIRF